MADQTSSGGRMARLTDDSGEAWSHVYNRLAGEKDDRPFQNRPEAKANLIRFLLYYAKAFRCELATYVVMDNHYHIVLRMYPYKKLSKKALTEAAKIFYPNSLEQTKRWSPEYWEQFNTRLFSLSELMRNVQQGFARWYNKTYNRRGRFWADRFKSNLIFGEQTLLEVMQYVDLNPIRAGLSKRPENYLYGAMKKRNDGDVEDLAYLSKLFGEKNEREAYVTYRSKVYLRGELKSKDGDFTISDDVLDAELVKNFEKVKLRKWRFMTDGLAIGSPEKIQKYLDELREKGVFKRRKNPTTLSQFGENITCLREQRSHGEPIKEKKAEPMWSVMGMKLKK